MRGTADVLGRVPLFSGLSEEKLAWVCAKGEEVYHTAGAIIARQGDPADGFYVILEGETEWTREVGGREIHAVTLGEGEVFAELILLQGAPYPTTGRSLVAVRLLKLVPEAFWEMLAVCPEVLRGVLRVAVERSQIHESVSQQQARLISLGNMAAGLAHELNNPASAVKRSAREARETSYSLSPLAFDLAPRLTPEQRAYVLGLPAKVAELAAKTPDFDPLEADGKEDELAALLEEIGVGGVWEMAPALVEYHLDAAWLQDLEAHVGEAKTLEGVLRWLVAEVEREGLLAEVESGAGRISELVGAVKEYSYMDRAPSPEEVDVREGIENTLRMLGHKLRERGVEVARAYDPDLPRVRAYGGELNQVWTELIDNAIDAAGSADGEAPAGHVEVRAARENGRVLVEVSDDGPGIPEEVRDRVFEPFFTTKPVGSGVGLGLDLARRAVEGHGGGIRAVPVPRGGTRMEVWLPVEAV